MSSPVTCRLDDDLLKAIETRANRRRRSRSDTIAELVRIGLDVLRFPGITFVAGPAGLRAHLAGTGLDVWEIVAAYRAHGGNDGAVLEQLPQLSGRQLRVAVAYYRERRAEIDAILREQAQSPEEWQREVTASAGD
jgi:uncharacterized protein (DUF433 family)